MLKPGEKIILATNNKGKILEISELLAARGFIFEPIGKYTSEEPEEDSGSYVGNALIKAKAASIITGLPALAEDSGIEFDAFDGWPAVETAPWVTSHGGWADAMKVVNAKVEDTGKPRMVFRSTYVLYMLDGTHHTSSAELAGTFVYPARGDNGFGHDPYMIVNDKTLGELTLPEKISISPRTKALLQLFDNV